MTTARKELVDVAVTRWYHCISRCVRSAFLMVDGPVDRKLWIENRLQLLAKTFAISVGGFAALDNHLHVLCRLDPEESLKWTAEQVVRRWIAIYPPANLAMDDPETVQTWVDHEVENTARIEVLRERLSNLGWFMKALKEPLARLANKADGCRGTFWEARYKSIAVLDPESLLATSVYIDLNPLAAGIAETPEQSKYTSIRQRVLHVRAKGKTEVLKAARLGSVAGSKAAGNVEQDHWLVPIEDRRRSSNAPTISNREGMLASFSLGSYLLLVDYTGRLYRNGKARMNSAVREVFDRLDTSQEYWEDMVGRMLKSRDLRGSFFASSSDSIRQVAAGRGKRAANLSPQAS
jgi:hypothetical protein